MIDNLVFGRSRLNSRVFCKTFHLIFMHSIHKIMYFEEFLQLKCYVFQKLLSKFSIGQTYCFTDRKCDKNLGYNLPGLIGAWLVLDRSKLIFDRSNLIFDWSKFGLMGFLKVFSLTCSSLYSTFQKAFCSLSLTNPLQTFFLSFSS